MQTVFHQVTGHRVTETVEEVRADTDECQVNPRFVLEQVGKGLERELLCPNGLQALLREQSAGQCHNGGQGT